MSTPLSPRALSLLALSALLFLLAAPRPAQAAAVQTGGVDASAPGPWLVYDVAVGLGMGPDMSKIGGAAFEVDAAEGGRPYKKIWRAIYGSLRQQFNRWYPYALNLAPYAGKTVHIRLRADYPDGRIYSEYPYWGDPRIVTGPLNSHTPPKEVFNMALMPIESMGGLLPDGTIAPLNEKAQYFGYEGKPLVTPGMVNRQYSLMVFAGSNYITVAGKAQPGVYTGFDMSNDWLAYGQSPAHTPYTGPMPPPVFAAWTVTLPPAPAAVSTPPAPPAAVAISTVPGHQFQSITSREDRYAYHPGLVSEYDPRTLTLRANMGTTAVRGWAFPGVETFGLKRIPLEVTTTGAFISHDENSFAGLIVDYHTRRGYQKRLWVSLGASDPARTDLRPGDWIYDEASFSRAQRLSFVNQFIDLSSSLHNHVGKIDLPLARYAPADWDGRIWLAAGVQNVGSGQGVTARLTGFSPYVPNPRIGSLARLGTLAGRFVVVNGHGLIYALSRTNGALCGMWVQKTGERLVEECQDSYHQERRTSVSESTERFDKVQSVTSLAGALTGWRLTCVNAALPGLTITKEYRVELDGVLSKRVEFETNDPIGYFLRWTNGTTLSPKFLAQGSRGGALAPRTVVANGKVVPLTEDVKLEQAGTGAAPMVIKNDDSLGIAIYRYRVNDRYVMRGGLPTRSTLTGWDMGVFQDLVKAGKPASGEAHWATFHGDFVAFERHYQRLPEVQKLTQATKIPDWAGRVVSDEMYARGGMEPFVNPAAPQIVTATIWFFNAPWGNWGPDHHDPNYKIPDIYNFAPNMRRGMPNLKLSQYHNFEFDELSDAFHDHPEYGIRDREGSLTGSGIASDITKGPTYTFQIKNPVVRNYLLNLHRGKMAKWKLDFYYTDGPGFDDEEIDWGYNAVAQSYDWLDYVKQIRQTIQSVKPDAAIFFNGVGVPYSDMGYIEFGDAQWQAVLSPTWRDVALSLLQIKITEPKGFITVPLYGRAAAVPGILDENQMFGWCGSLLDIQWLPWMQASWEYRGIQLADDSVEPRWWRTNTETEAYGFRKGETGIVNVMNHDAASSHANVTVDTRKLGLIPGQPLYIWALQMNMPPTEETDPKGSTKTVIVSHADAPMTPHILYWGKACPATLSLDIPTRPRLMSSVIFSPVPVVLESVGGQLSRTGLPEQLDITIRGSGRAGLAITCRAAQAALLLPGHSLRNTTVTGAISVEDALWCGEPALRITVKQGKQSVMFVQK